ncbi:30856_t:CDS:2, partial [Racocetra persica]
MSAEYLNKGTELYTVPKCLLDPSLNPTPYINSIEQYKKLYDESNKNPRVLEKSKIAKESLTWVTPFQTVLSGGFEHGDIAWFHEGQLNASYNCLDRHALKNPDKVAIIYEADEPGQDRKITFGELLRDVCRLANALKAHGVRKVHSVVFAGFSAESLRDRIQDASSRFVITADEGRRGGKTTIIKNIVDNALKECPTVKRVFVFRRTGSKIPFITPRDVWWHEEIEKYRPYCPPEIVNAEDPLFLLYTSGSTGKPKGILHTTAGYLLGTVTTFKYVFDYHDGDIFGCMSTPFYPTPKRYWEVVAKHKITHFYTAPTAIRLLRRFGREHIDCHDLSSLRIIGSV